MTTITQKAARYDALMALVAAELRGDALTCKQTALKAALAHTDDPGAAIDSVIGAAEYCGEGDNCRCGGDTQAVRETCYYWRKQ